MGPLIFSEIERRLKMSSYELYLEELLKVKEREIQLYKDFIEKELTCRIQEEVRVERLPASLGGRGEFKVITIPQSRYVINLSEITIGE